MSAALTLVPDPDSWRQYAACHGANPALWYLDRSRGEGFKEARAVCARCPVRAQCLQWALAHNERFGMWGGLSPQERRHLRRFHRPSPQNELHNERPSS